VNRSMPLVFLWVSPRRSLSTTSSVVIISATRSITCRHRRSEVRSPAPAMQRREWVRAFLRVSAAAAAGAATAADAASVASNTSSSPISITWAGRHWGGIVRSPAPAMNRRDGVRGVAAAAGAATAADAASVASNITSSSLSITWLVGRAATTNVGHAAAIDNSSAARGEIYRYSAATNIDGDSSISSSSTRSVTDSARGS